MDLLGLTHTVAATAALLLGPAVFFRRKGDRTHRRIGYAYVAGMVTLNVTALAIYDLFGRWGPFHYAALASLATLAMGIVPAIRRKPANWQHWHYFGMSWSYAGLLAAGVSETLTRLPRAWPAFGAIAPPHWFWTAVAIGTAAVMVGALYLIRIRKVGFPGP